ncbi:MAG: hypothetical protein ABI649_10220 [Gaiellaceae bacterium]
MVTAAELRRLRRLMAQVDYLEVRERELNVLVGALREATDRGLARAPARLTDSQAASVAVQSLQLGNAEAALILVRRQRARLEAVLVRRARAARRDLARLRLEGH